MNFFLNKKIKIGNAFYADSLNTITILCLYSFNCHPTQIYLSSNSGRLCVVEQHTSCYDMKFFTSFQYIRVNEMSFTRKFVNDCWCMDWSHAEFLGQSIEFGYIDATLNQSINYVFLGLVRRTRLLSMAYDSLSLSLSGNNNKTGDSYRRHRPYQD